jgi:hypothetical protein
MLCVISFKGSLSERVGYQKMRFTLSASSPLLRVMSVLLGLLTTTAVAELTVHDGNWQPDHILRITAQNISVACEERYSAVINGTSPGPELRLPAGQVSWIRVYNDMTDANLTMVSEETLDMIVSVCVCV